MANGHPSAGQLMEELGQKCNDGAELIERAIIVRAGGHTLVGARDAADERRAPELAREIQSLLEGAS